MAGGGSLATNQRFLAPCDTGNPMSTQHTFFNVITLAEDKQDEAFEAWVAVGEWMEIREGPRSGR